MRVRDGQTPRDCRTPVMPNHVHGLRVAQRVQQRNDIRHDSVDGVVPAAHRGIGFTEAAQVWRQYPVSGSDQ